MSISGGRIKKMLPKVYFRKLVAHEICVAIAHFKTLEPVVDLYVYNDGTKKNLMSLTGTIPVVYDDKTYNIPVCVWLEETYPQSAPICYVRPTRQMMVLQGKYVSSNGEVMLPYLEEWKHGECDLVSLLQVMAAMFGDFPPVCMQPPQPELTEQTSCWLQYHRESDERFCMYLDRDDGQPFLQENETNC